MHACPDAVTLTRKLLAFDTINPPGAEDACARYLGGLRAAAGFDVEAIYSNPGRR